MFTRYFKRISYIIMFLLITVNVTYSQKPHPFDRQAVLQNNVELQKLSYSSKNRKIKLSSEACQLLEVKGFKLLGQSNKMISPHENTQSNDGRLHRIEVSFDLRKSGYTPINFNVQNNSYLTTDSSEIIMTENFESLFPGTKWQRSGDPTWGKTNYNDHIGNYSIWCAKDGTKGTQPGNNYPNNCHSMIVYGPFDLSTVNHAQLKFWYWLDTEYEKDWFFAMASLDGNNFQGIGMSGESGYPGGAWDEDLLYLNNVIGLGDVTGHSQVWIAFLFESDNHSTSNKGVYIDNVELNKQQINGTFLAGIVSGEFTTQGNPFIAVGDLVVNESDTLEIKPGVEIRFEEGFEFIVLGLLKAIGTPSDSIIFTSAKSNPSPGDWGGIRLYDVASKNCRIQYCRIEYGGYGSTNTGASGIYVDTREAEISNCLIWKNAIAGISCGNVVLGSTVRNCKIINNNSGIYGILSSMLINNNLIAENETGVYGFCSDFIIKNNEIVNNKREGIYSSTSKPIIVSNIIKNNKSHGIWSSGAYGYMTSGLIAIGNTIINNNGCGIMLDQLAIVGDIVNNIVANNKINGIDFSGIVFDPNIRMYNNTIFQNNGSGVYYGSTTISNSRIFNNIIANHPQSGIKFKPSQFLYIWYNNFYNNNPNINAGEPDSLGIISKTNINGNPCDPYYNIFLDPSFKNANNSNFKLIQNSPCIDAGNPSAFFNDINGTKNDMGAFGGSALYVYPISYDFGKVTIGITRQCEIEIRNHRDIDFKINSLQISNNSVFSVSPTSPIIISPYSSKKITVTFKPTVNNLYSATLTINSDSFYGSSIAEMTFSGKCIGGSLVNTSTIRGTWSHVNSPYLVIKEAKISKGDVLTIQPGVKVFLENGSSINIEGTLIAVGTLSDTILFTRAYSDAVWNGLKFKTADSNSKLEYCKIEHSEKAGIYLDKSNIMIKNCSIQNNRGNYDYYLLWGGGGITCYESSPIIINNLISNNYSRKRGGGIAYIRCQEKSSPVIENNIICYNSVGTGGSSSGSGGGISIADYTGNYGIDESEIDAIIVKNNVIINNHGFNSGGGVLIVDGSKILLINNLIVGNEVYGDGGGIYGSDCVFNGVNNTIVRNKAESEGGGLYFFSGHIIMRNSILYSNFANKNPDMYVLNGKIDVTYSDIENGWIGVGNIDSNPLFIDTTNGDFYLKPNSPCIDKGNPDSQYNDPEDPNNTGYALFPAQGTKRNDMGAYGGPHATSWNIVTSVDIKNFEISTLPKTFELYQNYPNPFNSSTTITYQLPKTTNVSLSIYNFLGQLVNILVNDEIQLAGTHSTHWDGKNEKGATISSGLYFFILKTKEYVKVNKMVMIK